MTEQEVLAKMKEAEAAAERGPGHIKVTYTYPLKLSKANPGNHNQVDCYRESTDSLMVGVHTNNMKYAKDNFAATGQKVSKCPNGFDYPTNPEEQGYFWIKKSDGSYYVRAKFENIAADYKQKSRYFIDGQEVDYQDLVNAYQNGEFEKSALAKATDQDLFDRHVAVDRIKDIKILVKEDLTEDIDNTNIYIDTSGSLYSRPIIDRMIDYVSKVRGHIFYFSDRVYDTPTSGGSDYMRVIEHVNRTQPDNVVIVTDNDIKYFTEDGKTAFVPGSVQYFIIGMGKEPTTLPVKGKMSTKIDALPIYEDYPVATKLTDAEKEYYDGLNNPRFIPGEGEPFKDLKDAAHKAFEDSITEDYGWEIPTDRAWEFFERMKMELGSEELLLNLAKAMGDEKLADLLAYIARQFDMDYMFESADSVVDEMDFDDDYTGIQ